MASLTQCTWVWVDSWSWWWTGKPGVLQFMGSQRVRRNWVTELNWRAHRSFAKPTYYNQFLEIFILWPVFLIKQRKKVLSRWLLCLLTSLTAFWTLLQFLTWKKWQLFFLNDILVLFFFFHCATLFSACSLLPEARQWFGAGFTLAWDTMRGPGGRACHKSKPMHSNDILLDSWLKKEKKGEG